MEFGLLRREDIIESVFDDEAFARLPALLAQSVGARSAILHWTHNDGSYEALGYSHFTPEWINQYSAAWVFADPWHLASRGRVNTASLLHELVPERAFANSPIFNEFIRSHGDDTLHCMGGRYATPWGEGALGVHRGASAKPFEAEGLAKFEVYSREIGRVLKVKGELAATRREAADAKRTLDALAWAILVVSADARVLSANGVAERILSRGDGLVVRKGCLGLAQGSNAPLHAALQRSASAQGRVAESRAIARPADRLPYLITICQGPGAGRVMILFRDPDVDDPSVTGRLRGLFNLTMAEAAIAADLAKGVSVGEIAVRRGVSLNTLKTQLAAIMNKMNCHRQSEMVAIVASLPPIP